MSDMFLENRMVPENILGLNLVRVAKKKKKIQYIAQLLFSHSSKKTELSALY